MKNGERSEPMEARPQALIGWTTVDLPRGCLLRLQSARSWAEIREGTIEERALVLTTNQVRLLGEYLLKLADRGEGKPATKRRWWRL